jgi:hypothetical protein
MVIPFTATTESDNRCRLLQSISDNDHIIDCNKWHFNRFRCLLQVMNRLLLTAIIDWLAKRSLFVFLSWCTHSWLRKWKKSGRFASTIYLSIYPCIYRFAPTIYLSTTHLCNFTIIAIIICNNDYCIIAIIQNNELHVSRSVEFSLSYMSSSRIRAAWGSPFASRAPPVNLCLSLPPWRSCATPSPLAAVF